MATQQQEYPTDPANDSRTDQPGRSGGTTSAGAPEADAAGNPHLGTYPNGRNTDTSGAGRWQEGQNGHQMFGNPSAASNESTQEDTPESSRH